MDLGMRVRVGLLLSFVCGAAACAVPGSAMAGTLDQQQTIVSNAPPLNFGASLAQTFTPGVSGALDEVDLFTQVFGPPTIYLSVEIRDVNGGFPGSTVLATRNIPPSSVADFDFFPITFAPAVPVVAGTQYAIVAYSATPPLLPYAWYGSGRKVLSPRAGNSRSHTPPPAPSATPPPTRLQAPP